MFQIIYLQINTFQKLRSEVLFMFPEVLVIHFRVARLKEVDYELKLEKIFFYYMRDNERDMFILHKINPKSSL